MKQGVTKKYSFVVLATDVVIFTVDEGELKVLLIGMKKQPYESYYACPGGLVAVGESVDEAASRTLREKAGVKDVYLEQLYTFGEVDRDPFGRVVSVAYMALVPSKHMSLQTTSEYRSIGWYGVNKLPKLAYDHNQVIRIALLRLQAKLAYTNIAYGLMSRHFTLSELQQVYESILGKSLDKRNFRKKLLQIGLVKQTKKGTQGEKGRPAQLFEFTSSKPKNMHIL